MNEHPLNDWEKFVERSKKRSRLPEGLGGKVIFEFTNLYNFLMHNERPTRVAAYVCEQYSDFNVAEHLDDYVRRL
ncbi:MAG: hypothetical protein WC682_02940 [Parcubacteria group bacterium]|jgi:hypothetical protein